MNDVERAVSCFMKGFNCSQSIFSTYGTQFGLTCEIALKIAAGFGGGMGRVGKTCGVVTGAFMVIGLKYGNIKATKIKKKERTYELIREFISKFKDRNGTVACKELLDCDISTPEGRNIAMEKKLFIDICPDLVKDSTEILEEII